MVETTSYQTGVQASWTPDVIFQVLAVLKGSYSQNKESRLGLLQFQALVNNQNRVKYKGEKQFQAFPYLGCKQKYKPALMA